MKNFSTVQEFAKEVLEQILESSVKGDFKATAENFRKSTWEHDKLPYFAIGTRNDDCCDYYTNTKFSKRFEVHVGFAPSSNRKGEYRTHIELIVRDTESKSWSLMGDIVFHGQKKIR